MAQCHLQWCLLLLLSHTGLLVPTASRVPVPTASRVPVSTASRVPVPTASRIPVLTASWVPVSTASWVPIHTASWVPVQLLVGSLYCHQYSQMSAKASRTLDQLDQGQKSHHKYTQYHAWPYTF